MKNNTSLAYTLLLILGDFFALLAAFSLAYILRVKVDTRPLVELIPARTYFFAVFTVLPLWVIVNGLIGLYSPAIYEKRFSELGRLLVGSMLGILVVIGYDFVIRDTLFPARLVPVYGLALGFSFLLLFRTIARAFRILLFKYGVGITKILVIGDGLAARELIESMLDSKTSGFKIVGVVGDPGKIRRSSGLVFYPSFENAHQTIGVNNIHSIVQTELYGGNNKNSEILEFAQTNHIAYRFIPGNSDLFVGRIDVELFHSIPVVAIHQTALIGWGRLVKRVFDVLVSVVALIILSPIFILVGLLIVLLDPGPVFFRQERVTRFNTRFRIYKFRSHKRSISGLTDKDAFAKLGKPELYERYKSNGYLLDKDPRITPLGRFLRKTTLDEIPQLINVLLGDISLVGPRPLIAEELNTYGKKHTILSVKSGLTGLAQVSGRQNISFEERRKLDMFYVQNWSFWGDIVILLKTVRVVFSGRGAK